MVKDYQTFLEGNPDSLSLIIRQHKDGLILYLNGIVQNIFLAEELAEETFVKLIIKKPRFRSDSSFKTWLYAIGRNIAISHLRKTKNTYILLENCPELTDEEQNLERQYLQKEQNLQLHRIMKTLKPAYYQVLWLVYFEGLSHKETARIMGKTVHNTETLAHRARQALKNKLLEEGFVYENL